MRKKLVLAALIFNLILFTGCANEDVIVVEEKTPVTIRAVTMLGTGNPVSDVYTEICDEFRKDNPYVNLIDDSRVSDENWKQSIVSDFAAGNEPDVVQFFTDATANQLIAMDKFVSIEEIRAEYPDYAGDTYDWALSQVANMDGVMRAVPTTGFWEGMYCNKDLFDKYDVEIPTDQSSFERAIRKFREVGIIPVACSINNVPHYWVEHLLLTTLGANEYTGNFTRVTPKLENALKSMAAYRTIGAFPDNTDNIDNEYARDLFINKKAAMLLEGNWFLSNIKDTDNTVIMPFPGLWGPGSGENVIIGGMTSGFYISRRAWNNPDKRDAVVRFVMANTSASAVARYWKSGGGITTAATEVNSDMEYTPLEQSAIDYIAKADRIVLSTDSRMEPEAYRKLISGMMDVSNGGSANLLWEKVLELNNMYRKK